MKDKYYEAALKFCQEHGYKGNELPKYRYGPPSMNCPVTIALEPFGAKLSAYGDVSDKDHNLLWSGGELVSKFQQRADGGFYPELEEPQREDTPYPMKAHI